MGTSDMPASDMVVGMGDMIERVVNLKGELVGKRNGVRQLLELTTVTLVRTIVC